MTWLWCLLQSFRRLAWPERALRAQTGPRVCLGLDLVRCLKFGPQRRWPQVGPPQGLLGLIRPECWKPSSSDVSPAQSPGWLPPRQNRDHQANGVQSLPHRKRITPTSRAVSKDTWPARYRSWPCGAWAGSPGSSASPSKNAADSGARTAQVDCQSAGVFRMAIQHDQSDLASALSFSAFALHLQPCRPDRKAAYGKIISSSRKNHV